MSVLVLRQNGPTALPDEVVEAVEQHPGLQVLDRSAKMLRVEGNGRQLQDIADRYHGVEVSEERSYGDIGQSRPMARMPRNQDPGKQ